MSRFFDHLDFKTNYFVGLDNIFQNAFQLLSQGVLVSIRVSEPGRRVKCREKYVLKDSNQLVITNPDKLKIKVRLPERFPFQPQV